MLEQQVVTVHDIDQITTIKWIEKQLADQILERKKEEYHNDGEKDPVYQEFRFLLKDDIVIHVHSDHFCDIMYLDRQHRERVLRYSAEIENLISHDNHS